MKHSIKRVQSQAGLSFAERKNVRPSVKQKLLFLLVLLMTAATNTWAASYRLYLDVSGTSATLKYGSYDGKPSYISGGWDAIGDVKTTVQTITTDATSCASFSGTTLNSLFYEFTALTSVDLSGLNTAQVTNMSALFGSCTSLTSVDLSGLNTSKVTTMGSLFSFCSSLTSVDLSSWDTSSATNMGSMFYGCSALTSVNLSSFNTSNVTIMGGMFNSCSSLTTLDLSSFNTSKVTAMPTMFEGCTNLATIYVGNDWSTDAVNNSNNMFKFCTKLPNFNSSKLDHTNAHTGEGGYLSTKPYKVTLQEGTEDATNWTVPEEAAEGTTVTATYSGTRKVKSVKAVKKAAPKTLAEATTDDIGKIAGKDGNIYATKADAEAVATGNAVAMIAYVGTASDCAHGLAIALADESDTKNYGDASTACSGKAAVTGGTWRLPSEKDWQYMFIGCGSSESYSAPTYDPHMSKIYSGLASKLTTAQGAALLSDFYWSSTKDDPNGAWGVVFDGSNATFYMEDKTVDHKVRACLAF